MTTSEWISVLALIISSGGFAIQARNWFFASPRLHLSLMADAIVIPDDGEGPRASLTVINRGAVATRITHMLVYCYEDCWNKFRRKPILCGVVNSPMVPSDLEVNGTWSGQVLYNAELTKWREEGLAYVGVIASHSDKQYLVRIPKRKPNDVVLNKKVASG
jgi:hypothetical protein